MINWDVIVGAILVLWAAMGLAVTGCSIGDNILHAGCIGIVASGILLPTLWGIALFWWQEVVIEG